MNTKLTSGLLGFGALLMSSQMNGATVQIRPANNTIIVGGSFALTVQGIDFAPTNGGGFSLTWDENAVELLTSVAGINNSLLFNGFIPVNTSLAPGRLDVSISTVIEGFTLPTQSGNFDITTLDFVAVSPPSVTNISFIANQPAWVDENNVAFAPTLQPNYVGASISITTPEGSLLPVPAAVWLFGSGLLGLIGVARRKVKV